MFVNFTERARKVIFLAHQEAERRRSGFIGPEHLFLGILQGGGGVAVKVLQILHVDLRQVIAETERLIPHPEFPAPVYGQLPFSPEFRRTLELAVEEARLLSHDVSGTEHLLLGLLKEHEGIAAQVLTKFGLRLDEVHAMIHEVLDAGPDSPNGFPPPVR
jgi:ATP-dependent Clp protease ATP-binding subunit ClpC